MTFFVVTCVGAPATSPRFLRLTCCDSLQFACSMPVVKVMSTPTVSSLLHMFDISLAWLMEDWKCCFVDETCVAMLHRIQQRAISWLYSKWTLKAGRFRDLQKVRNRLERWCYYRSFYRRKAYCQCVQNSFQIIGL